MTFIFPVQPPYTIGLRHGEPYPNFARKILHLFGKHRGVDIIASKGKVIIAPADGLVHYPNWHYQGGKIIIIDHPDGTRSWMAHFSKRLVPSGTYVKKGQQIGEMGSTGLSTGSHLHWHIYNSQGQVDDPLKYIINETIMAIQGLVKDQMKKIKRLLNGEVVLGYEVDTGKFYEIKDSKKEEFTDMELIRRYFFSAGSKETFDKIPNK